MPYSVYAYIWHIQYMTFMAQGNLVDLYTDKRGNGVAAEGIN